MLSVVRKDEEKGKGDGEEIYYLPALFPPLSIPFLFLLFSRPGDIKKRGEFAGGTFLCLEPYRKNRRRSWVPKNRKSRLG